jgi:hypothetical protein
MHLEVVMALVKAKYLGLLKKEDFTEQEYKFIKAVENSAYKDSMYITKDCHKKFALVWKSKLKLDLGCVITEKGIVFSNPISCYDGNMHIPTKIRFREGDAQEKIINQEVKEIKELLLIYSEELEKYFY